MPNKKERIKVIDYLYAEMTSKEREAYNAELNNFPELKENINNFKSLRNSMRKWKGTGVPKNIVDSFEIYSAAKKMERTNRSKLQFWSRAVFVGGVFIILLAVLNLNVSFSSGRFSISFGLLSRQADTAITGKFSGEIDKNNEQLLKVVRDYILERDQRQIDEIVKLIKASETRSNEKRKFELKAIYTELANLKLNTNRYLVNANQAIQGLFQYMSRINSNNTNSSENSI
jgi:hypothetical protein